MGLLRSAVLLVALAAAATAYNSSLSTIVEWFDGEDLDGEPGCQYGVSANALRWKKGRNWCRTQCDNYTQCEMFGFNWDILEYTDVTLHLFYKEEVFVPGIGFQIRTHTHWVGAKRKTNVPFPEADAFKWAGMPLWGAGHWAHTKFGYGQPDGIGNTPVEDCVRMDEEGWLYDDDCDIEQIFACKRC